jgi:hypothetical protein
MRIYHFTSVTFIGIVGLFSAFSSLAGSSSEDEISGFESPPSVNEAVAPNENGNRGIRGDFTEEQKLQLAKIKESLNFQLSYLTSLSHRSSLISAQEAYRVNMKAQSWFEHLTPTSDLISYLDALSEASNTEDPQIQLGLIKSVVAPESAPSTSEEIAELEDFLLNAENSGSNQVTQDLSTLLPAHAVDPEVIISFLGWEDVFRNQHESRQEKKSQRQENLELLRSAKRRVEKKLNLFNLNPSEREKTLATLHRIKWLRLGEFSDVRKSLIAVKSFKSRQVLALVREIAFSFKETSVEKIEVYSPVYFIGQFNRFVEVSKKTPCGRGSSENAPPQ